MDAAGGAGSNGFSIAAQALAALGIRHMYGVIGIPVTELASAAQVCCPSRLRRMSTHALLPESHPGPSNFRWACDTSKGCAAV